MSTLDRIRDFARDVAMLLAGMAPFAYYVLYLLGGGR